MKKKYILLLIMFIFISILCINTKSNATDLDKIENYVIKIDPRMTDGSLDIIYEITWKVLDSTKEGPLTWVKIGTPNENFDSPTALTDNIKSISKYSGAYVRIDFKKAYNAGETVNFKYSIHQKNIHNVSWGKCTYKFTPAWFTDIKIDNLVIKWNSDQVKSSNTKKKEDNYLVWKKENVAKGEKLTIDVKYDKATFSSLKSYVKTYDQNDSGLGLIIFIGIVIFIVIIYVSIGGGGRWILPDIEDFMVATDMVDTMVDVSVLAVLVHTVVAPVHIAAVQARVHVLVQEVEEQGALKRTFMEPI